MAADIIDNAAQYLSNRYTKDYTGPAYSEEDLEYRQFLIGELSKVAEAQAKAEQESIDGNITYETAMMKRRTEAMSANAQARKAAATAQGARGRLFSSIASNNGMEKAIEAKFATPKASAMSNVMTAASQIAGEGITATDLLRIQGEVSASLSEELASEPDPAKRVALVEAVRYNLSQSVPSDVVDRLVPSAEASLPDDVMEVQTLTAAGQAELEGMKAEASRLGQGTAEFDKLTEMLITDANTLLQAGVQSTADVSHFEDNRERLEGEIGAIDQRSAGHWDALTEAGQRAKAEIPEYTAFRHALGIDRQGMYTDRRVATQLAKQPELLQVWIDALAADPSIAQDPARAEAIMRQAGGRTKDVERTLGFRLNRPERVDALAATVAGRPLSTPFPPTNTSSESGSDLTIPGAGGPSGAGAADAVAEPLSADEQMLGSKIQGQMSEVEQREIEHYKNLMERRNWAAMEGDALGVASLQKALNRLDPDGSIRARVEGPVEEEVEPAPAPQRAASAPRQSAPAPTLNLGDYGLDPARNPVAPPLASPNLDSVFRDSLEDAIEDGPKESLQSKPGENNQPEDGASLPEPASTADYTSTDMSETEAKNQDGSHALPLLVERVRNAITRQIATVDAQNRSGRRPGDKASVTGVQDTPSPPGTPVAPVLEPAGRDASRDAMIAPRLSKMAELYAKASPDARIDIQKKMKEVYEGEG